VVPVHEEKAVLKIELPHQPEDVTVGIPDGLKIAVFEQLIPITNFNVGESLAVIVSQSMKKQVLVVSEIISPTVVPPVAVTK
jgi:hypothetical protein